MAGGGHAPKASTAGNPEDPSRRATGRPSPLLSQTSPLKSLAALAPALPPPRRREAVEFRCAPQGSTHEALDQQFGPPLVDTPVVPRPEVRVREPCHDGSDVLEMTEGR